MPTYAEMDNVQLAALKEELEREYGEIKARGLALNMARGKPAKAQLDLSMPLLETVMDLLAGYGLSREDCAHWQRVLRAILHGFISQEDLGYFYYYKDTELEKSREVAIQCFLNGLHAEASHIE